MSLFTNTFHGVPVYGIGLPAGTARLIASVAGEFGLQLTRVESIYDLSCFLKDTQQALVFAWLDDVGEHLWIGELMAAVNPANTVVVAVTPKEPSSAVHSKVFELGVSDVVHEPVTVPCLRQKLRLYIELQQRRCLDIREKKQIRFLQGQIDVLLNGVSNGVIITTTEGHITTINDFALQSLGYGEEQLVGQHIATLMCSHDSDDPTLDWIEHPLYTGFTLQPGLELEDVFLWRSDGGKVPVDAKVLPLDGEDHELRVLVFEDISLRKEEERKLDQLIRYDPVTGLANVSLMRHFLLKAMARVLRNDRVLAVILLDLDDFHCINENFGFRGGDLLLKSVARRLKGCIRTGDMVCRYRDDQFVVVLDEIKRPDDAVKLSQQMLHQVSQPHDLNGVPVVAQASVGIAHYPKGAVGIDELLDHAATAMEIVKRSGKNGVLTYSKEAVTAAGSKMH